MPQKLPNGITTPINADAYNLAADLATMGNTANVIIPVANQAVRDALTKTTGMAVCRLDMVSTPLEIWDGTTWWGASTIAYTPALTGSTNPVLGTGSSQLGQYTIAGKIMTGALFIAFGTSGSSVGSGTYTVSLPTGYTYSTLGSALPIGIFTAHLNGTQDISGYLHQNSAGSGNLIMTWQNAPTTQSNVSSSTVSWGNGSYISANFTLPIA